MLTPLPTPLEFLQKLLVSGCEILGFYNSKEYETSGSASKLIFVEMTKSAFLTILPQVV